MKRSWYIPRRTLLLGAGAAVALPFLDQMQLPTARGQQASGPKRFVAIIFPNGFNMSKLTPSSEGAGYALTPILSGLSAVKDDVTVITGMQNSVVTMQGNAHLRGFASFLTGSPSGGTLEPLVLDNSVSVDQVMAQKMSGVTAFPSLELSAGEENAAQAAAGDCDGTPCLYGNVISWKSKTQPAVGEENPQSAFDRLFSGYTPGTPNPDPSPGTPSTDPAATAGEMRRKLRLSVLDAVSADTQNLSAKLGPSDKMKLDQYLTSLRELEQRLAAAAPSSTGGSSNPVPPSQSCGSPVRPSGAFANDYAGRLRALFDVAALALQCDRTRVITIVGAGWESEQPFDFIDVGRDHHGTSHHGGNAGSLEAIATINTWEVSQYGYFLGQLKNMAEGSTTVLHNSLVYMGSDVSDGDKHNYVDMPVLVGGRFGGVINAGRHVKHTGVPISNLLLTGLQGFDPAASSFGNSTGALNLG